jgi:hypothetical protein
VVGRILRSNFLAAGTGSPLLRLRRRSKNIGSADGYHVRKSGIAVRVFAGWSFPDDPFIDGVDSECLRLRAHGFKVAATWEPLMWHSLERERNWVAISIRNVAATLLSVLDALRGRMGRAE